MFTTVINVFINTMKTSFNLNVSFLPSFQTTALIHINMKTKRRCQLTTYFCFPVNLLEIKT